jgi:hypothetical protein
MNPWTHALDDDLERASEHLGQARVDGWLLHVDQVQTRCRSIAADGVSVEIGIGSALSVALWQKGKLSTLSLQLSPCFYAEEFQQALCTMLAFDGGVPYAGSLKVRPGRVMDWEGEFDSLDRGWEEQLQCALQETSLGIGELTLERERRELHLADHLGGRRRVLRHLTRVALTAETPDGIACTMTFPLVSPLPIALRTPALFTQRHALLRAARAPLPHGAGSALVGPYAAALLLEAVADQESIAMLGALRPIGHGQPDDLGDDSVSTRGYRSLFRHAQPLPDVEAAGWALAPGTLNPLMYSGMVYLEHIKELLPRPRENSMVAVACGSMGCGQDVVLFSDAVVHIPRGSLLAALQDSDRRGVDVMALCVGRFEVHTPSLLLDGLTWSLT